MNTKAFISYSHADAKHLERLHKHLAVLLREGSLQGWTDKQILPGSNIDSAVKESLDSSQLFLALVSADYLASRYCYDKEFLYAVDRASSQSIRIVPIILEPCDWLSSPLSSYLALPTDGKAVSEWANQNNAYLDIVTGIRRVLSDVSRGSAGRDADEITRSKTYGPRRLKIEKEFDAIDKKKFADSCYATLSKYFERSCAELSSIPDLKADFEVMSSSAFTATVVNRAVIRGREAHITVRRDKSGGGLGDISYTFQSHDAGTGANGTIRVGSDEYNMFLTFGFFGGHGFGKEKLDAPQVADAIWNEFVAQAGIKYE